MAQGRSGRIQEISPPPGFDPRTDKPVASRYTDYAVPAHCIFEDAILKILPRFIQHNNLLNDIRALISRLPDRNCWKQRIVSVGPEWSSTEMLRFIGFREDTIIDWVFFIVSPCILNSLNVTHQLMH